MREDRLALPIPAGMKWWDEMPRVTPTETAEIAGQTSGIRDQSAEGHSSSPTADPRPLTSEPKAEVKKRKVVQPRKISRGGMWVASPKPAQPGAVAAAAADANGANASAGGMVEKKAKVKRPNPPARFKFDPKHVAMARELRDRYLEQVNSGAIELPQNGKYDVRRRLDTGGTPVPPLLEAAISDSAGRAGRFDGCVRRAV